MSKRPKRNAYNSRVKRNAGSSTDVYISPDDLLSRCLISAPGRAPSSFTSNNTDEMSAFMASLSENKFMNHDLVGTNSELQRTQKQQRCTTPATVAAASASDDTDFSEQYDSALTEEDLLYSLDGPDKFLLNMNPWYMAMPCIETPLKEYQKSGAEALLRMLSSHNGALLADEVGLGKTLQSIAVVCHLVSLKINQFMLRVNGLPSEEDDELIALQSFEMRKPHARARVRGEPTLIVVPVSALAEWIRQIVKHTTGLTAAVIESDECLNVYVSDSYRNAARPLTINGYVDVNALRSFDVIFITYKRLHYGCKLSGLMTCYENFKLFDAENRAMCNAKLSQLLVQNAPHVRSNLSSTYGVFDNWCRPSQPVGRLMIAEPLGRRALWSIKPLVLITDEAHMLNNPNAQITRVMLTLCASNYLYITATPSNNHLLEFATLFVLMRVPMTLNTTEWRTLMRYQRVRLMGPTPEELTALENDREILNLRTRFEQMLSAHKLSRLGNDVGMYNHFCVHRHVLKHPFVNRRERQINDRILAAARSSLDAMLNARNSQDNDERRSLNLHFQALITRGKQIATTGCSIKWSEIIQDTALGLELEKATDLGSSSTKVRMIKSVINDKLRVPVTDKVIITSYFVGMLNILERELTAMGFKCVLIVGSNCNAAERMTRATRFQTDPTIRVCLISLRIATSITLSSANHVLFADPWVSPGLEEQAAGRVMRLCQLKSNIFLWYFIVAHSIEEHVHSMAVRKKEEVDRCMYGSVDAQRMPSRADMMNLRQLRECIGKWENNLCSPDQLVQDEWAIKTGNEPLAISEGESHEYDAEALMNATDALVERALLATEIDRDSKEEAAAAAEDEDGLAACELTVEPTR